MVDNGGVPHRLWAYEFKSNRIEELERSGGLRSFLENIAIVGGSTPEEYTEKLFTPQGSSAILIISESSVDYHSWPEHCYARIKYDTCTPRTDFGNVRRYIDEVMSSEWSKEHPVIEFFGPYVEPISSRTSS